MDEKKTNTGAVPTPPPVPKPRFTNSKSSGIEPGRLNGGRKEFKPSEPELPPDVVLKRKIRDMSVSEYKQFVSEPANLAEMRRLGITR